MGKSESRTHGGMKNLCNRYLHVGKIVCHYDGTVVQIRGKKMEGVDWVTFFPSFSSKIKPKLAIKDNREQHNSNASANIIGNKNYLHFIYLLIFISEL